jgi:alpha-beta hydrolase superfamily lysophospholipase
VLPRGRQCCRITCSWSTTPAPRPTVVFNSGYDSTLEEAYFTIAVAALRRGYNVIAFDGPGQRAALRQQQLVFQPDWEACRHAGHRLRLDA